jgi:hypothetical protein
VFAHTTNRIDVERIGAPDSGGGGWSSRNSPSATAKFKALTEAGSIAPAVAMGDLVDQHHRTRLSPFVQMLPAGCLSSSVKRSCADWRRNIA